MQVRLAAAEQPTVAAAAQHSEQQRQRPPPLKTSRVQDERSTVSAWVACLPIRSADFDCAITGGEEMRGVVSSHSQRRVSGA